MTTFTKFLALFLGVAILCVAGLARTVRASDSLWSEAVQDENDGKLDVALQKFQAAEKEFTGPKSRSDAANAQGLLHLKMRKLSEAIADFDRALTYQETSHALNNLGVSLMQYYELGKGTSMDVAKAVTVYAKLEALDPEYKKDNRDAAKAMLDKSLKEEAAAASPVTPPAKGSYSDYNKAGSNALKQLQYKAAIACFDKMAAQAEGTKAVALASNRLGWAYICDRQYKNAIAPLSTACRLDPANKLYAKNLGYACKEAYLADETQGADLVLKAKDAFTKAEDTDNMGWVDDTLKSYPEAVTPTAAAATEMSTPVEKSPKTAPAGVTSSAK